MSGHGRKAAIFCSGRYFSGWPFLGNPRHGRRRTGDTSDTCFRNCFCGLSVASTCCGLGQDFPGIPVAPREGGHLKAIPSDWRLLLTGFLTNFTNRKSIAWYTSIFAGNRRLFAASATADRRRYRHARNQCGLVRHFWFHADEWSGANGLCAHSQNGSTGALLLCSWRSACACLSPARGK